MIKKAAVIDLGTNTFHLLIAESLCDDFRTVLRRTEAVKLGEGGINDGVIHLLPFERGLRCMDSFAEDISKRGIGDVRAIATSAIRNARNGQEFIDQVKAVTGINIEIIDGMQEAKFIYSGIKAAGCLKADDSLIMDIGGGSVEFIIGNSDGVKWKQSFEIGAARMMGLFHQQDPIPVHTIGRLNAWLEEKLEPLFDAVKSFQPKHLIGSAGSFETFAAMIEEGRAGFDANVIKAYAFLLPGFMRLADLLQASSNRERREMKAIIPLRVDMIVSAAILTKFIIQRLEIEELSMSTFSLKEGVMAEMLGLS